MATWTMGRRLDACYETVAAFVLSVYTDRIHSANTVRAQCRTIEWRLKPVDGIKNQRDLNDMSIPNIFGRSGGLGAYFWSQRGSQDHVQLLVADEISVGSSLRTPDWAPDRAGKLNYRAGGQSCPDLPV